MGKFKNKIVKGMMNEYRLLDSLGSSGNSVVYKAEANGILFAIKFLDEKKNEKQKEKTSF